MPEASLQQILETALGHQQAGRMAQAVEAYRQLLKLNPNIPEVCNNLGIALASQRKFGEAIDAYRQALALRPRYFEVLNNLGATLQKLGRHDEAISVYREALQLNPNTAALHNNLGNALQESGRLDQAILSLRRALVLQPNFPQASSNLGHALSAQDKMTEAILVHRQEITLRPKDLDAHINLGNALSKEGQHQAALAALQTAVALDPQSPDAHNNLGHALQRNGEINAAISEYHRALAIQPDHPLAHWNLSSALLLIGDYPQGWQEYEWRWRVKELAMTYRDFSLPQWNGQDLQGKRILLHTEQAYGDAIQFVRFTQMVAPLGAKILLECRPPLAKLFQTIPGIEQIIPFGDSLPKFDLQCPLLSLPGVFKTTLQTIPNQTPYLFPADSEIKKWAERFPPNDTHLKVGLAWAGRKTPDPRRAVPPILLSPLGKIPGVHFFSLNKPESSSTPILQPDFALTDWTAELKDFADTAALIANLDLVITVDTSIAHLAGALGKPTWVLLKSVPDWRWLLNRSDSPWYPTIKLFRQPTHSDWQTPIQQIAQSLATFANLNHNSRSR
jgi:Flp pilus assembly protein TadD